MLRKRLLVLTPRFPYPTIGGDRIRILHLCRALSAQFSLTLLSLCESREEMRFEPQDGIFQSIQRVHLPRWRSCLNALLALPGSRPLQLAYYESAAFRRAVDREIPHHDLVLAHLIRTGQYIVDHRLPRILEMTDAIAMNYARFRQTSGNHSWKKALYLLEQERLERYETRIVRQFDRVWLTSETDRRFLDPDGTCPIDVIPNGTDLDRLPFRIPSRSGGVVVFIGNMVSLQNQDACHFFIREILPRVRRQARIVFRIVGNAPDAVCRQFQRYEGVELTGRIEHIRDGVDGAFCGVCPVRAGAGIQNKVLEYLALGLPCVTSPVGLGGVEACHGREVLVYRSPDEAAAQILALQADPSLRVRLAVAGRDFVDRRHDWRNLYRAFVASCVETCTRHPQWAEDIPSNVSSAA